MLWPTHTVSVARRSTPHAPYVTGRAVYLHTRALDTDLAVQPPGQPLHTFMSDNAGTYPAYRKGDIVTLVSLLTGASLPPVTKWTIDDVEARGPFWPYVRCQLTAVSV